MRIFITGGTGFVGKSLFRHLRFSDDKITILSRNPSALAGWTIPTSNLGFNVTILQGDVRDFKYPEGDFDYILHGAATSSKIIPDSETQSVILEGTQRVLDFAKTKDISNFLFVSSGAVYGTTYFSIDENYYCNPNTTYGRSKLEAEEMCIKSGLPYSIARCFAFIGEDLPLDTHFAIGNFIKDCLEGKDIMIKGDGTPLRSYMYSKDLVEWLWTIMLKGRGIYNVGSDKIVSIAGVADLIRRVIEKYYYKEMRTPEMHILQEPVHGAKTVCYAPIITKARNLLGLGLTMPLEGAVRKTINYHRRGYANI